jgi:hypothetical protein
MIEALKLFDSYNRQARLYPALLALLPLIVTAWANLPASGTGLGGTIFGLLAMSGGLFLLAEIARAAGKALEPKLLASWGGWPTTRLLRHSDQNLPALTKQRYSNVLASKTAMAWPTEATESADAASADDVYRAATDWLRQQTRGAEFGLLLSENASYGFRRNMLGLKTWAMVIAVVCALAGCASVAYGAANSSQLLSMVLEPANRPRLGAAAFSIVALLGWTFVVTSAWVKAASETYATALLACCDRLP